MGTIGFYIFYGINWIITLLPLRILYIFSDLLFLLLYYFPSYRRKIVTENLRNSFPEKSTEEIVLIEKKFYRHLADLFIETLKLTHLSNEELKNLEVKFQISFRLPLNRDFFVRNSHLWFAYTQLSLWQLYNHADSSPFRESNYEPELIWAFLVNKSFGDLKLTHVSLALNHQSNGQPEPLSRSWNRVYINSILAYENWVFSFRPWYRIPEDIADDDNPDIEDYMGNFDIRVGYKQDDHQFSSVFRSALDQDNPRSYYELGYSFSINRKFRGYVQFINGYGESLIDYNYRNKRLSLGIMLNDWF